MGDGVVVVVEAEAKGVAHVRLDLIWVVEEASITTDNDMMDFGGGEGDDGEEEKGENDSEKHRKNGKR